MTDCPRQGRWIGGCKFESRYDIGAPDFARFTSIKGYDLPEVAAALKPKTYVHDICIRCGKTVKRP